VRKQGLNWSADPAAPVTVTAPARTAFLADLAGRMDRGQGYAVATLNLDHVVKLRTNPAFRRAYAAHSHVTADGHPIVWLTRLAGLAVDLVPGSEIVLPVAQMAAAHGVPVALFGSNDAALSGAAAALERAAPGLNVVARIAPPYGFDPESPGADVAIAALRQSGARLVFLALGAPKQEIFAARAAQALPQVGFLSIGAGLDFLAGQQQRAPRWMQRLALEWLWRLVQDPRRLAGRYAACLAILPALLRDVLRLRRAGRQGPVNGG
jgi:exopolysaccharide biosynthesis WecB/TagA/CpsF family protein